MSETLQQTINDILDYLMILIREDIQPEEARQRLRFLQKRHPDAKLDLLWEKEEYDQSIHYDALLHLTGNGTVSLSFCPDRALPWPMRGVHRWSEGDLARVNNTVLGVDQAMACLDFIWDEARIINRLINVCLIQEEIERDPIELSDVELQVAMDAFRRAHRLCKAEDTYRWMEQRGLTHVQFEHYVSDEAMVAKLRDRITDDHVEDYFENHRADFDTAFIARLKFADKENAQRTCEQIYSGKVDFYEAAQRHFLAEAESLKEPSQETFSVIQRSLVAPEMAASIFPAAPGEVLEPIRIEDFYLVVRVLSFVPARLDEPTRNAIKKILFEEWLEERRQAARIEWFWGNASRTSRAA